MAYNLLEKAATKSNSETQAFVDYIGKKMEKYTAHTNSAVQQAILKILFDADAGKYDKPSYTSTYPAYNGYVPYYTQNISSSNTHQTFDSPILLETANLYHSPNLSRSSSTYNTIQSPLSSDTLLSTCSNNSSNTQSLDSSHSISP